MASIVPPTPAQLEALVAPYLEAQPNGLGFAIGYASPTLDNQGGLYFAGNIANQFGTPLTLGAGTPFELASISKTFTATLYARMIRSQSPGQTLGDFMPPAGPLAINPALAGITLDSLMSYTSGLPQDNGGGVAVPPFMPQAYSLDLMLSYLGVANFDLPISPHYAYSNLGFALMGAVLGTAGAPAEDTAWLRRFLAATRRQVFQPLGLDGTSFFNEASLATLPLGYDYDYTATPKQQPSSPGWPAFPAYFSAGGIVATPADMQRWLLFNMGLLQDPVLTPLLPALQQPATSVTWGDIGLGLGWFLRPASSGWAASVWKDGSFAGTNTYIAFLPSENPGTTPSQAGAFVLVNADGITSDQTNDGVEVPCAIANDLLFILQGQTPPADKSAYASLTTRPRGLRRRGPPASAAAR